MSCDCANWLSQRLIVDRRHREDCLEGRLERAEAENADLRRQLTELTSSFYELSEIQVLTPQTLREYVAELSGRTDHAIAQRNDLRRQLAEREVQITELQIDLKAAQDLHHPSCALTNSAAAVHRVQQMHNALTQVDDVLVVNWITVKDNNYRQALTELVETAIREHEAPEISPTPVRS